MPPTRDVQLEASPLLAKAKGGLRPTTKLKVMDILDFMLKLESHTKLRFEPKVRKIFRFLIAPG